MPRHTWPHGWLLLCVSLLLCAAAGLPLQPDAQPFIDWQAALWRHQPWRLWTPVAVHYSPRHLGINLAGLVLLAWLGWTARLPTAAAWTWFMAWPLTHLALALRPDLAHYGGLSGVLHAGAAVAAVWLSMQTLDSRHRLIGLTLLLALLAKILDEAPWGPALRYPVNWDIAIAPVAHATGLAAGASCAWGWLRITLDNQRL